MQAAFRMVRMPTRFPHLRNAFSFAISTLCTMAALAQQATLPEQDPAVSLRTHYEELRVQLDNSSLQPGLYLESIERSRMLQGDIYALVDYPYGTVSTAFLNPENWCEALILHLNIKYCRAGIRDARPVLSVAIGKKIDQPLSDTYRIEFAYSVTASTADYMQVNLNAKKGPVGTKNHLIALEIVAMDGERAFVHVQYSYTNGFFSNLATNIYLGSSGKDKVGFTRIDPANDGQPTFIGGLRGAAERNTMRYYLAIDAYLSALSIPPPDRFEESAKRWFDATERYARQLHEVDRDTYLSMKRSEYLRQQMSR